MTCKIILRISLFFIFMELFIEQRADHIMQYTDERCTICYSKALYIIIDTQFNMIFLKKIMYA